MALTCQIPAPAIIQCIKWTIYLCISCYCNGCCWNESGPGSKDQLCMVSVLRCRPPGDASLKSLPHKSLPHSGIFLILSQSILCWNQEEQSSSALWRCWELLRLPFPHVSSQSSLCRRLHVLLICRTVMDEPGVRNERLQNFHLSLLDDRLFNSSVHGGNSSPPGSTGILCHRSNIDIDLIRDFCCFIWVIRGV